MNPVLLLSLFGRKPELVTPPLFTANTTWVCPAGVTMLTTAVGRGAAGTPGSAAYTEPSTTEYRVETYRQQYTRDSNGNYFQEGAPSIYTTGTYKSTKDPLPGGYCDPAVGTFYYCYTSVYGSRTVAGTFHPAVSATTGASATGFGKTFPGGTGGTASNTTFNNIAVTAGASYPLVIPSGGAIQISYYL